MHAHRWSPTPGGALECPCGASLRPIPKEVPVTVPTNNEEAEAFTASNGYKVERLTDGQTKITRHSDGVFEAVTWCGPDEYLAIAEHALAARRLPVSVDRAEARAEAERRWPRGWDVEEGTFRDGRVSGFILGAEWLAAHAEAVRADMRREVEWEYGYLSGLTSLGGDPHVQWVDANGAPLSLERAGMRGRPVVRRIKRGPWLPVTPSTPNQQGAEQ